MATPHRLVFFNRRRYEDEASNFMDALIGASAVITSPQAIGIDRFFKDMKGISNPNYATSDWSAKPTAMYPKLYGTSATHKFNMIDPRDLDEAFRLTFVGSPLHNSLGVKFDGVSSYARTHCAFNSQSRSWGVYSQSNIIGSNYCDMGCYGSQSAAIYIGHASLGFYTTFGGFTNVANTDTRGLFSVSRSDGGDVRMYKNGAQVATVAGISATLPDEISIGGWLGQPTFPKSPRQYSFAHICRTAFTATEEQHFRSAVQALHQVFNRAL